MPAYRRARELDPVAFAADADNGEITGAAAHIANQYRLAIEQFFVRSRQVRRDPRIECGRRFFKQRKSSMPAARAASTVSSRASSSKLAGTVKTTSCSASGVPFVCSQRLRSER